MWQTRVLPWLLVGLVGAFHGCVPPPRVSATACKCTKTDKMKMWHFSGTKFAVGLA
jgi:hypothetical protein